MPANKACTGRWGFCRIFKHFSGLEFFLLPDRVHTRPSASNAYRAWVKGRVQLAREYFEAGRNYFARVQNTRCRLACFAYIARFDWLLDTFEREDYYLRSQYDERKSTTTGLRMGWLALSSTFNLREISGSYQPVASRRLGKL